MPCDGSGDFWAAEPTMLQVVREKLYRRVHRELPYRLDVKLTQSDVLKDGSSLFHYTIFCPSEQVSRLTIRRFFSSSFPQMHIKIMALKHKKKSVCQ